MKHFLPVFVASIIMFFSYTVGITEVAGQLVCDEDFERDAPFLFPFSCWQEDFNGGGFAVAGPWAHSGLNGLWIATGNETGTIWSSPYQEFLAAPGNIWSGSAWIRTAITPGEYWVEGSSASVRIEFWSAISD